MKITLGNIFQSKEVIEKLIQEKLSIKTLYKLNKLIELLPKELEFIEKQRMDLVKKFGEETTENNYKVKDENINEFNKELTELFDIEIDLSVDGFTVDELQNIEMNYIEYQKIKGFLE